MIRIENLSHSIGSKAILQDICLDCPTHKITALIGPNGAGKSTLLSVMSRLSALQSGTVVYHQDQVKTYALQSASDAELSRVLAILTQSSHVNSRITVSELLMFGRYPHHHGQPKASDHQQVETIIEQFALSDLRNRYLDELSGGQRQLAFIGMVFCQQTDYLLLDEPLNNLDLYHANRLMQLIRQSATEKTLVIVLHDINQALAYADHIVAMKAGKVLFSGSPEAVISPESIQELFGVAVDVITHNNRQLIIEKHHS